AGHASAVAGRGTSGIGQAGPGPADAHQAKPEPSMRRTAFALLACLASWLPAASAADPCPDREAYAPGRALIAELDRIVAPGGVQEAYEVEVTAVRHCVNVRGHDRYNPLLLFVHAGPAAPV